MLCPRLSGSESVCTYFQTRENVACGLRIAVVIIAICGMSLSIGSIVRIFLQRLGMLVVPVWYSHCVDLPFHMLNVQEKSISIRFLKK